MKYTRLPDWWAWETFGFRNGCASLDEMRQRIHRIRQRMRFRGPVAAAEIGCMLIVQPTFFPRELWVPAPRDWSPRIQKHKRYDLAVGEGARVWEHCQTAAGLVRAGRPVDQLMVAGPGPRFGAPVLVAPRLGQGTFRVAVADAYGRACAVTGEHSLPALEAAHIRSHAAEGPHLVSNGVFMRADFHRLFEQGHVSIADDFCLLVSPRHRADFANGRSYYPFESQPIRLPDNAAERPAHEYLAWHRESVYLR